MLGITADVLRKQTSSPLPKDFWQTGVPTFLYLRKAALRLFSVKAISPPLERGWNSIGDIVTPKRRSMSEGWLSLSMLT